MNDRLSFGSGKIGKWVWIWTEGIVRFLRDPVREVKYAMAAAIRQTWQTSLIFHNVFNHIKWPWSPLFRKKGFHWSYVKNCHLEKKMYTRRMTPTTIFPFPLIILHFHFSVPEICSNIDGTRRTKIPILEIQRCRRNRENIPLFLCGPYTGH